MSDIFNKAIPITHTPKEIDAEQREKNLNRQLGAQKAWAKRRAKKEAAEEVVPNTSKPVSDRHKFDWPELPDEASEPSFTLGEAITLAGLIAEHPFLRKLLK
jgi:hypothetical protein